MAYPHLTKAPVNEALVDIQFQAPPETKLADLVALHEVIRTDYPDKKERRRFEGNFQFKIGETPVAKAEDFGIDGYQFWSANKEQVVQFRLNGFTYSRLRPYGDWKALTGEARRLWSIFSSRIKPSKTTRLAVRFINQMPLPLPIADLDDYLRILPKSLDQPAFQLDSFMHRQVLVDPQSGITTILTSATEPVAGPKLPVLLDIDVFLVPTQDVSDEGLWQSIDSFRDIKNRFFFGSITDKTVELFK